MHSALQNTKVPSVSGLRYEFSELTLSNNLRTASRLIYDSMSVGLEKARNYSTEVHEIAPIVKKGMK